MNKDKKDSADAALLRLGAEERLRESRKREVGRPRMADAAQRLVHELEVHQIELEMQNQELARSKAEVEAGLKQYTDLYDFAPVGYFTLSRDGAIRRANLTGAGLLGMERARLVTRRFGLFVSAESRPAFNALLEKAFEGRRKETCEMALVRGGIEPFWAHIDTTCSEDNQECHVVVMDITERKKMEKALQESRGRFEYKSFHDGLTGLYNRDYFSEQITHVGKDLARSAPVSIILIDIDGLKIVNDTLGHKAGDDLLISTAKIISESFREVDIVARIGGDEFCIILPGVDHKGALAKKKRISESISLYNSGNPSIALSMSVGVATSQDAPGETIYDIYQRADENMYEYKLLQTESQKSTVIDMLLSALSERDFVAQGHAERLSVMSELMAERIDLSDDQTKNLVLLAKLHDIGKVGIPDKILFKPRKLSEEESKKMKEHAQIGYNLACRSKILFHISDLIRHHHEFWDGNGYTEGLKGEQIPLECRIFSILDAYDAMTNTRPYSKGISKKRAIKELHRCSGTQFEPRLVDAFVEFVELAH